MGHLKDHLIPLPVADKPGMYGIRFVGVMFDGSKEDCEFTAGAIKDAARRIVGPELEAEFRRDQYLTVFRPLLNQKRLPAYAQAIVPDWAREMHDAEEISDAA